MDLSNAEQSYHAEIQAIANSYHCDEERIFDNTKELKVMEFKEAMKTSEK